MPKLRIATAEKPKDIQLDVAARTEADSDWSANLYSALQKDSRFYHASLFCLDASGDFKKTSDIRYEPSNFFSKDANPKTMAEAGRLFIYGANETMPRQVVVTGNGPKDFAITEPLEQLPSLAQEPPVPDRPSFWKYLLSPFISRFAQEIETYRTSLARHEDIKKLQEGMPKAEATLLAAKNSLSLPEQEKDRDLNKLLLNDALSVKTANLIRKVSHNYTPEELAQNGRIKYSTIAMDGGRTMPYLDSIGKEGAEYENQAKDMTVTPMFYLADDPNYSNMVRNPSAHKDAALAAKARIEAMDEPAANQELARLAGKALEQNTKLTMEYVTEPGPQNIAHQNRLILAMAEKDPNRLGLSEESILMARGAILRSEMDLKSIRAKCELMDALINDRDPENLEQRLADIYTAQALRNAADSPQTLIALGKDYDPATNSSPELERLHAQAMGSTVVKNMAEAFRNDDYQFIEDHLHSRPALVADARNMILEQAPVQNTLSDNSKDLAVENSLETNIATNEPAQKAPFL